MQEPTPKYLTYQNIEGTLNIEVLFEDDTVWLTLPQIAALLEQSEKSVLEYIAASIDGDEFNEALTVDDFKSTTGDNNNPDIDYFNLKVVWFVGDHFSSFSLTKFTIWAIKQMNLEKINDLTDSSEDLDLGKNPELAKKLIDYLAAKGIDLDDMVLRVNTFDDFKELLIPIINEFYQETVREEKDEEIRKSPLGPTLN